MTVAASNSGAANQQVDTRAPAQQLPYFIECGVCGHEPSDQTARPRRRCPKCHALDWRRVYRPDTPAPPTPFGRLGVGGDGARPRGNSVVRTEKRVFLPSPLLQGPRGGRKAVLL